MNRLGRELKEQAVNFRASPSFTSTLPLTHTKEKALASTCVPLPRTRERLLNLVIAYNISAARGFPLRNQTFTQNPVRSHAR